MPIDETRTILIVDDRDDDKAMVGTLDKDGVPAGLPDPMAGGREAPLRPRPSR